MKNVLTSLIIFIFLVISILFSINYVKKTCTNYKKRTDYIENIIKNDSWNEAYTVSTSFLDDWKKESKIISIFIDHDHIDKTHVETLKLTQYIKYKDKSNALASIHAIKFLMEDIIEFENINIQNIF